eukprot:g832.t1
MFNNSDFVLPSFVASALLSGCGMLLHSQSTTATETASKIKETPACCAAAVASELAAEGGRTYGTSSDPPSRFVCLIGDTYCYNPVLAGIGLPQNPVEVVKTRNKRIEVSKTWRWKWNFKKERNNATQEVEKVRDGGSWISSDHERVLSTQENGDDIYIFDNSLPFYDGPSSALTDEEKKRVHIVRTDLRGESSIMKKLWTPFHNHFLPIPQQTKPPVVNVNVYNNNNQGDRNNNVDRKDKETTPHRDPEITGYKETQEIVPLGKRIFALGEVSLEEGADIYGSRARQLVMRRPRNGKPFVFQYGSRREVLKRELANADSKRIGGNIMLGLGAGFGLLGLVGYFGGSMMNSSETGDREK